MDTSVEETGHNYDWVCLPSVCFWLDFNNKIIEESIGISLVLRPNKSIRVSLV